MTTDQTHLKFVIPRGEYCYTYTGRVKICNKVIDGEGEYKKVAPYALPETRTCPFWVGRIAEGRAFCTYLGTGEGMIFDQIKECGVNMGREKTYLEAQERRLRNHPGALNSDPEFLQEVVDMIESSEEDFVRVNGLDYTLSSTFKD